MGDTRGRKAIKHRFPVRRLIATPAVMLAVQPAGA